MRILIGTIGKLGYLVKQLPRSTGKDSWSLLRDETSLSELLRGMSLGDAEIRGVLRTLRAEGRAVLSLRSIAKGPRLAGPPLAGS